MFMCVEERREAGDWVNHRNDKGYGKAMIMAMARAMAMIMAMIRAMCARGRAA